MTSTYMGTTEPPPTVPSPGKAKRMTLTWTKDDALPPQCGAKSSTHKSAMSCELPPGHVCGEVTFEGHYGRDRRGGWRAWPDAPTQATD